VKLIFQRALKPDDRIVLPGEVCVQVLNVDEHSILVEVFGGDRDDDNLQELELNELPDSFQTW
jgi:hypothetical protein